MTVIKTVAQLAQQLRASWPPNVAWRCER